MSKKLAAGAHVIVLDVKTGSGAFMREPDQARALAAAMVDIGTSAGRRMAAVVSDMSQPLGRAVGNALEVAEVLDTLAGLGPPELTDFGLELAATIVALATDGTAGRPDVERALTSGAALRTLRRMVEAQGGDTAAFDDRTRLPTATRQQPVLAEHSGYVVRLDALTIAHASIALGAGRERKGDPIDLSVGIVLQTKVGDKVERGQPVAILHGNDPRRLAQAERILASGVEVSSQPCAPSPLILERLGSRAAQPG